MKCGHCKREGSEITVSQVRACSSGNVSAHAGTVAPVRTWQENKAVAVAKVLGSSRTASPATTDALVSAGIRLNDVPAGRYALDNGNGSVRFYRVDRPTEGRWAGYTFVKVQASDEEFNVKNRQERESILARIAVDPAASSKLYGIELGVCGVCGRTLTNDESRAAGIGPVCAAKF